MRDPTWHSPMCTLQVKDVNPHRIITGQRGVPELEGKHFFLLFFRRTSLEHISYHSLKSPGGGMVP